jgi:F-type H+-transporting ATPase subunit b
MEINLSELIWSVVNFCVLLLILSKFLYKPVMGMLDSRSKEVADSLAKAENARLELETLRLEQSKELEKVRAEAQAVIASASKLAEDARTQIVADAQTEAAKLIEKSQAQIKEEKERAIAQIRGEMATLAIAAASKLIEKNLSGQDQEKLVEDFLSEVAS